MTNERTTFTVTPGLLARAQTEVQNCIACNPEAETEFRWLLRYAARETGYPAYILPVPAVCPNCGAPIEETTLVQPVGGGEAGNWVEI